MSIGTELRLTEDERELLAGILHCSADELEETLQPYANAALEEYCRMILGQKVFTRIQDIKEFRLYLLIREVFNNRIPDDQKIADLFQTTPSESRSLVRSIASKYQYELRSAIRSTLREVIENAEKDPENGADWLISVNSSTKIEELNNILGSIDGSLPQIAKKRQTVSSYVIKPSSYTRLCEEFGITPQG